MNLVFTDDVVVVAVVVVVVVIDEVAELTKDSGLINGMYDINIYKGAGCDVYKIVQS